MIKLKRNLSLIIISAMLCISISTLLLDSLQLALPIWAAIVFAFVFSFITGILMIYHRAGLITVILLIAGAGFFWWLAGDAAKEAAAGFIKENYLYLFGSQTIPLSHSWLLSASLIFAVSFLFTLLTILLPNIIVVALITFLYIILQWIFGAQAILQAALAAAALLALFIHGFDKKTARVRNEKPAGLLSLWAIPLCITILLTSYMLTTSDVIGGQWRWFSKKLNLINDYLYDYTGFDSPRSQFSIAKVGFQPLGDRLGGPLVLKDTPVLSVDTVLPVLLRGSTKNHYTGINWEDTTISQRYRLNNRAYFETKNDVFNLQLPDSELFGSDTSYYYHQLEITITNLYPTGSTLFTPYRMDDVKPVKAFTILPYYNDEGEVFSSRDIQVGTSYVVTSPYIDYSSRRFAELMASIEAQAPQDPAEKSQIIERDYLELPGDLPDIIYQTTQNIISGIDGDYQKALAIKKYLGENFIYTTRPDAVPEGVDFVANFLETNEGYCTYFASAMAVMARVAGLPSRYVEGFKTDYNVKGKPKIVEMRDAHAWAEIYFEGFGWIPFDAVPSTEQSQANPATTDTMPDNLFPVETPMMDTPYDNNSSDSYPVKSYLWVLYVLLALGMAIAILSIIALARNSLKYLRRRYNGNLEKIATHYYTETIWLLEYYNRTMKPGETLIAYARQIDGWLKLECGSFLEMAQIISMMVYADITPTEIQIEWMERFRRQLAARTMKSAGLPRFFFRQAVKMKHKKL